MLRRFFAKLRATRRDPTRDWPRASISAPSVDCARRAVGELRFGDSLSAARCFGRPDAFRWTQPGYCELLYAGAGFQIDFDSGRFAYAAFFVAEDEHAPRVSFSTPRVDSIQLSRETSFEQIEAAFGRPVSRDRDDDETILFYARRDIAIEFEVSSPGLLKRVNVYPTSKL